MADKSDKERREGGMLAEFETPGAILHACDLVRQAGYRNWDAHTPFPVHGLDRAMGLRPSKLPWIVLAMALSGTTIAMAFQGWVAAIDYPLVISGKPLFSWQAFVPVTFEVTILLGAIGAVFGMLALNRLPRHNNWRFHSKRFERASDDGFFISIDAEDPRFDREATERMLESAGASHVEWVEV